MAGVLPEIGEVIYDPADRVMLTPIEEHEPLAPMDEDVFGYRRGVSDVIMPTAIPVLADIGEALPALPGIIDPVIERYFAEQLRQGPRLLACSRPGTPVASRLYVGEFPPGKVLSRSKDKYYELNMPYLIAVFAPAYNALHLACRGAPVTPEDTAVHFFPFPNTRRQDGDICISIPPVINGKKINFKGMEALEALGEAVNFYYQTGYWYFYQNPQLNTLAPDGPIVTSGQHDEGKAAQTMFKWWETKTQEEVLAFTYHKIGDLVPWVKQFDTSRGKFPLHFYLEP